MSKAQRFFGASDFSAALPVAEVFPTEENQLPDLDEPPFVERTLSEVWKLRTQSILSKNAPNWYPLTVRIQSRPSAPRFKRVSSRFLRGRSWDAGMAASMFIPLTLRSMNVSLPSLRVL
jgi:hypothetical protein